MVTIQDFRCYTTRHIVKILCAEFMLFLIAFVLSYISSSYFWFIDSGYNSSTVLIAVVYALSLNLCLYLFGLYNKYMNLYLHEQFLRAISAILIQFIILSNISYWLSDFDIGKQTWLYSLSVSYVFLLLSRTVFCVVTKSNYLKSKTVVLGASNKALQLKNHIDSKLDPQTAIVGYIYKPGEREKLPRDSIIDISINNNNDNELLSYCLTNDISTVVVAVDDRRSNFPLSHLLACKQKGINIMELMEFYEHEFGRVELSILDPGWVIYSDKAELIKQGNLGKIIFDTTLAATVALLLSPLLLLIFILLKLNNGLRTQIIHSEIRLGRFSNKYKHYEFNCYNSSKQLSFIGKIVSLVRLQSLPVLWNIIKGDVSFVGPQSVDAKTDKALSKKFWYFKQRYASKPGVFAWGYEQANYNALSEIDKVDLAEQ